MGANPWTKPQNTWVVESTTRLKTSTSDIAVYYYYSARELTLILLSHKR